MICPPKVDRRYYCTSEKKHSSLRQSLLIVALLQGLWVSGLSAAAFSDAEIAEILAAHNAVRQRVARVESQRLGGTVIIPDLIWDSAVAALAQEWADSLIKRNPPTGQHRQGEKLEQLGSGRKLVSGLVGGNTEPLRQGRGGELGRGGKVVSLPQKHLHTRQGVPALYTVGLEQHATARSRTSSAHDR